MTRDGTITAVMNRAYDDTITSTGGDLELTRFRGHLVTAGMVMPQGFG